MVFVDTGAWFALSIASDPDHLAAKRFIDENREPLITTDYVVDELLTLFVVRKERARGVRWVHEVLGGLKIVQVSEHDFHDATRVYLDFADKAWSFTDCTSYVLIRRLRIEKALSFDKHFREFGVVQVLP